MSRVVLNSKSKSDKNPKDNFKLSPVTGKEFRHFVKDQKDKVQIVCVCFEPMEYIGQHNYKNMNYYVLAAPTCVCKDKFSPIPYLPSLNSYYAVDPAFMRIDHNDEYVPSSMGLGKDLVNVPKLEMVVALDPVFRIVQKDGYMCSEPLSELELLKYYDRNNLKNQKHKKIEFK
jgi:hypothetical protein